MPTVTIYTRSSCQPCKVTKREFAASGVPFTEINLEELPEEEADIVAARFRRLRLKAAPVVLVGDVAQPEDFWCGFNYDGIERTIMKVEREREQPTPAEDYADTSGDF